MNTTHATTKTTAAKTIRVSIRERDYHGKQGFVVSAGVRPWGPSIFVRTQAGAEAVKAALRMSGALECGHPNRAKADAVIDSILSAGL